MAAAARLEMKADNVGSAQSVKSEGSTNSNSNASCSALKTAYNDCFNRWYTEKFLKGQWEKEECIVEWEAYRACLSVHYEFSVNTPVEPNECCELMLDFLMSQISIVADRSFTSLGLQGCTEVFNDQWGYSEEDILELEQEQMLLSNLAQLEAADCKCFLHMAWWTCDLDYLGEFLHFLYIFRDPHSLRIKRKRLEDRNLSHLLKIENLMLASNPKRTKPNGGL